MNLTTAPTIDYSKTFDLNISSAANTKQPIFFPPDRIVDGSILTGIKVNVLSVLAVPTVGNLSQTNIAPQADLRFFTLNLVRENPITKVEEEVHSQIPLYDLSGLVANTNFRYIRRFFTRITLQKCYIQKTDAAQAIVNKVLSVTLYYRPI